MELGPLLNQYGLQPGAQGMQQPMGAGGGLLPQMAPQAQGMGLLPLLVGTAGTLLGGGGFGQGFMGGMRNAQDMRQQALYNQMGLARFQREGQRYQQDQQDRQQQMQAQQQAAQQAAQMQAQTKQVLMEQYQIPEGQADIMSRDQEMVRKVLQPKPVGPANYQAWLMANPGGTYEDFMRVQASIDPRGSNVTVDLGGPAQGLSVRPLTPEEGATLGLTDQQRSNMIVDSKGRVGLKPITPDEQAEKTGAVKLAAAQKAETAQKEKATRELAMSVARLDELSKDVKFGIAGIETKAQIDALRQDIAQKRARVLEPTGKLTDSDIAIQKSLVPDPLGPLDALAYPGAMEEFRRASGILPPQASDAEIMSKYGLE